MVLLLVFMQLTRDLFAIAKFLLFYTAKRQSVQCVYLVQCCDTNDVASQSLRCSVVEWRHDSWRTETSVDTVVLERTACRTCILHVVSLNCTRSTHCNPVTNSFLTNRTTSPSPYQMWCKNADRCPQYGPKTKFKMAAAAILNLLPVAIFNMLQNLYKISCKYLNRRLNYNKFFFNSRCSDVTKIKTKTVKILPRDEPVPRGFPSLSRWRPSVILELLHHHIGPLTKSLRWDTSACQILC